MLILNIIINKIINSHIEQNPKYTLRHAPFKSVNYSLNKTQKILNYTLRQVYFLNYNMVNKY